MRGCSALSLLVVVGCASGSPAVGDAEKPAERSEPEPVAAKEATPEPEPAPLERKSDALPHEPLRKVDTDGDQAWVVFRDPTHVLIGVTELAKPRGILELDILGEAEPTVLVADDARAPFAWSPDTLAYTREYTVVLHAIDGRVPDRELSNAAPSAIAWSPSGMHVVVTASEPGPPATAVVYEAATGKVAKRLQPFGKRKLPYDSAFYLAARFVDDEQIAFVLANDTPPESTVAVWSWRKASKRLGVALTEDPAADEIWGSAPSVADALALGHDGTIYAGNFDPRVHVIAPGAKTATGHALGEETITALAISPDGSRLAAAGELGPLVLMALPAMDVVAEAPAPKGCGSLAFAPDGRHLAAGCDGEVWIYDATRLSRR